MKTNNHSGKNKTELVKAAQTVGADLRADAFWADVQRNLEVLSGTVQPNEIKPRRARQN